MVSISITPIVLPSETSAARSMIYGLGSLSYFKEGSTPYLDAGKYSTWRNAAGGGADTVPLDQWLPVQPASGETSVVYTLYPQEIYGTTLKLRWKSTVDLTFSSAYRCPVTNATWDGLNGSADLAISDISLISGLRMARTDGTEDVFNLQEFSIIPVATTSRGTTFQEEIDDGHFWVPDFIDPIGDDPSVFSIRFMDQFGINRVAGEAEEAVFGDLTSDHVLLPSETGNWNRLIPPEVVADFANQTGIPAVWITFPPLAGSSFITEYATRLLAALTGNTLVICEYANEVWNPQYLHGSILFSRFLPWVHEQGSSATTKISGVSVTEGATTISLPTGTGASVSGINGAYRVAFGPSNNRAAQPASVSGDTLTLESGVPVVSGTYDLYFGLYELLEDATEWKNEAMRQSLETVFTGSNTSRLRTVIAGQAGALKERRFTIPALIEVDPDWPLPATRHEVVSISTYFGINTPVPQSVIDAHAADDVSGALATLHPLVLTELQQQSSAVADDVALVAQHHSDAIFWPYEGGQHIQYGGSPNILPLMLDYVESAYMEELASEWFRFQRTYWDIGCLLEWYHEPGVAGIWGKTLNNEDYSQTQWGSEIDSYLGNVKAWRATTVAERIDAT